MRGVDTDGCMKGKRHSQARPMRGCLQRFSEGLDPREPHVLVAGKLFLCKLYSISVATIQLRLLPCRQVSCGAFIAMCSLKPCEVGAGMCTAKETGSKRKFPPGLRRKQSGTNQSPVLFVWLLVSLFCLFGFWVFWVFLFCSRRFKISLLWTYVPYWTV